MSTPTPPPAGSIPGSVLADGTIAARWVPVLANPLLPTLAEMNAAGSVDLSCYLTPTGLAVATEEAAVNDDRLCSRETYEQPGRITDTLELTYVYDPQNKVPAENRAFVTLKRNTRGFIVCRWGVDFENPLAVADVLDVYPVTCGEQRKQPGEANSTLKTMQKMFVRARVRRDVVVAA